MVGSFYFQWQRIEGPRPYVKGYMASGKSPARISIRDSDHSRPAANIPVNKVYRKATIVNHVDTISGLPFSRFFTAAWSRGANIVL